MAAAVATASVAISAAVLLDLPDTTAIAVRHTTDFYFNRLSEYDVRILFWIPFSYCILAYLVLCSCVLYYCVPVVGG